MRIESTCRVPSKATRQEIQESLVVAFENLSKIFGAGPASSTLGGDRQSWLAQRVEEQLPPCALFDQMLLGRPKDLHYARKLLLLILAGEDRIPRVQLGQDTPQTPYINRHAVRHAQDHLRRSIETALDIGVDFLVLKAARPKVDCSDFGCHRVDEEDVLRLQITVDDLLRVEEDQCTEHLLGEPTDQFQGEPLEVVRLDKFVQVHPEQFRRDTEMAPKVEALCEVDHAVATVGIPLFQLLQKIDLDQGLLMESLLVPDDLHRYQRAGLVIDAPHNLAEAPLAQDVDDLISIREVISNHNVVVPAIIVVAEIRRLSTQITDVLLCILSATEVDVFEINNLSPFEDVEVGHLEGLGWADPLLRACSPAQVIQVLRRTFEILPLATQPPHFLIASKDVRVHSGFGPRVR